MARAAPVKAAPEVVIEARGLTRLFGSRRAVDGVDLEIYRGEVFGFLGPNGAGKSTLIRMLIGLLAPSSGSARVLGYKLPDDAEPLRERIGYMTQRFSLYDDLSIVENLDFVAEIYGLNTAMRRERVEQALEEYGLTERRSQRPATLSGGWKQRLALAAATLHRPELLVLDEPTAGVDPDSRRFFWEKLFELASDETTILVSTHYMDEAVRCHRLCMLRDGRRAALGAPAWLTARLAGRTVELQAEPIERAIAVLRTHSDVSGVTQLGNRAHVLLEAEGPRASDVASRLRDHLEAEGLEQARVVPSEPSLEDVFIALIRGEHLDDEHLDDEQRDGEHRDGERQRAS